MEGIKKIAVFFDVDDTLIKGQTQKLMLNYFYQKKKINSLFFLKIYFWFFLYKIGIISKGIALMEKAYKLLNGMRLSDFKESLLDLFEKEIKARIYPQAIEKINFHRKEKHEIILLSKSCKVLIDIIKDYLNLPLAIGTELEIKNGILTGKIEGKVLHGEEKVKKIKELASYNNWDLKDSYAYTDHHSDLPLLKIVGHPCLVNPDNKLKKESKKYNWPIFYWKL